MSRASSAAPARGDPAEECEAVADNYVAARRAYQAGTAASSTAWNAYITVHNAGRDDSARVSQLKQSYDRIAANLDRALAVMADRERSARDFEALRKGRCDLNQITGNRYRPLPPAKG